MKKLPACTSTALGIALISLVTQCPAQTWITDASGSWQEPLNWLGGSPPDSVGCTADFSTLDILGNRTVTTDAGVTVGHLKFSDLTGAQTWTLTTNNSADVALTLATAADRPSIEVLNSGATNRLAIAGNQGFVKLGPGWITLQGPPNSYSGPTIVSNGTIFLNKPAGVTAVPDALEIHSGGKVAFTTAADQIADTALVTVRAGGVLNLNDRSDTVNQLILDGGMVTNNSGSPALQVLDGFDLRSGHVHSVLAGTAQLINKTTPGTVVLAANNTCSGGILISDGILQIGAGGTTGTPGAAGASITNNARLVFHRGAGATLTVSGMISGSGTVVKTGPGTVALTGANTYTGGTIISNGTVNLSSSSSPGDASGVLHLAGGTLNTTANRSATTAPLGHPIAITADSAITTSSSAGTVELNLTSGAITGTSGSLTLRNDGANDPADAFEPRFSGAGFHLDCPVVIDNGPVGLTRLNLFNTSGTTQVFNGPISGSGSLRKSVATGSGGTTILNGTNTYAGATGINSGILLVNGTLGTNAVTVGTGATLGGSGTVHGSVTIQSGGILSPGISIGTLTLSNTLTLAAGSKTILQVTAGSSDCDRIKGLDEVTFGGTLQLEITGNFTGGEVLQLFEAGSYNGSFANITPSTPGPGLEWNISQLAVNGTLGVSSPNTVQPPTLGYPARLPNGLVRFSFDGAPGQAFRVWACTNLGGQAWTLLTNTTFGPDPFLFTDTESTNHPQRFYRVTLP